MTAEYLEDLKNHAIFKQIIEVLEHIELSLEELELLTLTATSRCVKE